VATITEELGVVLVLATDGKVAGVVVFITLEDVGIPASRRVLAGEDGEGVDGREGGESEGNQLEHGGDFEGERAKRA
jgi:hypothetical protein